MIPKLLLIASLGLTPVQKADEVVDETPTEEVIEPTEEQPVEEDKFDWNKWLEQWFSPEQVAMIMSWVAYAGTIIGLIYKLRQLAKSKNTTVEDVKRVVLEEIKKSVNEEVAESVKPYLDNIVLIQNKTNEIMQIFSKILALSQNNDAQSRVAILELIASLGIVDQKVLDNVKETIKTTEQAKVEAKNEALNQIDTIIEETKVENEEQSDDGTKI